LITGFEEAWWLYSFFQEREKKDKRRLIEAVLRPAKLWGVEDRLEARLTLHMRLGRHRGSQMGWAAGRKGKQEKSSAATWPGFPRADLQPPVRITFPRQGCLSRLL